MYSRISYRNRGLATAIGLLFVSLFSLWAFQSPGETRQGARPPQAITKSDAGRIATQFLGKVKGPVSVQAIDQIILEGPIPETYEVVLVKRFNLTVSRQSCIVIGFVDTTLHFKRYQRKGRSGRYLLKTQESAEAYMWGIARSIGVPSDARMDKSKLVFDDVPGKEVPAGDAACRIVRWPNGYPVLDEFVGMTMLVDPQDGALVEFTQNWDYATIAKPAFKINKAQALDATRKKSKAMVGVLEAQLGYARDPASKNKSVAKLYWGVRRKGADLWPVLVDAVTGVARERF